MPKAKNEVLTAQVQDRLAQKNLEEKPLSFEEGLAAVGYATASFALQQLSAPLEIVGVGTIQRSTKKQGK